MKDSVIFPPSSQHISSKEKYNRYANEHYKNFCAQAKARNTIIQKNSPSLDINMHDVLE